MLSIPETGALSPGDLSILAEMSGSAAENTSASSPSLVLIIAGLLIISSLWAIMNILFARWDPTSPQDEDRTTPQPEYQYSDQRPMMFVMGFLMLLLPYISILEPDMAHHVVLFLRFTGMGYMGLFALYLNPEVLVSYHWVVYLFGSSIGPSLLLTQHSGRIQPRRFELVLLVALGISALSMRPLITLRRWLNQPETKQDQQFHPEEGRTPPHQPPDEPRGHEKPSNADGKHSPPNIRGGNARKASKTKKYKKTLRWFAS